MRNFTRLERFLNERMGEIYPEPMIEPHNTIIKQIVPKLLADYKVKPDAKILDVGCGPGLALHEFRKAGFNPIGIGFGEEAKKNRNDGFEIIEGDMSFLDFDVETFDLVWCRHVLEHSVFPYFTLSEMHRILKTGGILYVEVPAPNTNSKHEQNKNHYSVLTKTMWSSLLDRAGFSNIRHNEITFDTLIGPDLYLGFQSEKRKLDE